jgi:hypothetical protein
MVGNSEVYIAADPCGVKGGTGVPSPNNKGAFLFKRLAQV